MYNIIKNVCKILFKRKSFVFTTFILPLILIFGFAALYSSNSTLNIAVENNDTGAFGKALENRLKDMKATNIVDVQSGKDDISDLIFHKYEMKITIDKDFTKDILAHNKPKVNNKALMYGENQEIVNAVINNQINDLVNLTENIDIEEQGIDKVIDNYIQSKPSYSLINDENRKTSINSSLGIIFYIIFVSAGIIAGYILEDEREGTKDRVLMSRVSEKAYYAGLSLIFFVLSSIPAIEYYVICKLCNYEFGFENTYILLIMLLISVLLAVVFNILVASIVKNKTVFTTVVSTVTVPLFMLSGAFWPFDMMSESLQNFGSALPPRWFFSAIEKLQSGQDVASILPMISGLVLVVIFLFLLTVFFTRNKIVLVKR